MVFTQYRILAYILVPLALGGVSYFYGYRSASNACRAEAEKALSSAVKEAKASGAMDKKLAEKAITNYNKTKESLDEIVSNAKAAVEADPDSGCTVGDDELLYLNPF